ncbi:MAG: type II toxin-antitoxin system death-on-curing family toxin [Thermoleophilaceae bacterium]
MRSIELADLLLIAEYALGVPAEQVARITKISQAESALAAPFAGFGEVEFYEGVATKAAILCSRIIRNHPLPDGNKRVAYVSMVEFIERNGGTFSHPADGQAETAGMIERLAAREITEEAFVVWVNERTDLS